MTDRRTGNLADEAIFHGFPYHREALEYWSGALGETIEDLGPLQDLP